MSQCHVSFPALGSTAVVAVSDTHSLDDAMRVVEQVVDDFDLACSRFREDSELSAINRAAGKAVRISPLACEAIAAALRAARLTDGDVDPTVGRALIALGYDRDFDLIDGGRPGPVRVADVPGWRRVELDAERQLLRIPLGVTLDLGATAKALAADRAAAAAHEATGAGVLVGLGGDFAAVGEPPDGGWEVRVTDDHRAGQDAPGQTITVRDGGLATSSTTVRRWGTDAHHVVDPATGWPATVVWRTVSVAASSCLDANIAATAAIIRGEAAAEWLRSLGLPSRLVSADSRAVHLSGWPRTGDDLAPSHPTPVFAGGVPR